MDKILNPQPNFSLSFRIRRRYLTLGANQCRERMSLLRGRVSYSGKMYQLVCANNDCSPSAGIMFVFVR